METVVNTGPHDETRTEEFVSFLSFSLSIRRTTKILADRQEAAHIVEKLEQNRKLCEASVEKLMEVRRKLFVSL